ncbi:MAG: hypothetical protein ACREQV_07570, partial [Candidatus Binatia bacterium]
ASPGVASCCFSCIPSGRLRLLLRSESLRNDEEGSDCSAGEKRSLLGIGLGNLIVGLAGNVAGATGVGYPASIAVSVFEGTSYVGTSAFIESCENGQYE